MKAEKQDSRLVQVVCAGMAGLECAARRVQPNASRPDRQCKSAPQMATAQRKMVLASCVVSLSTSWPMASSLAGEHLCCKCSAAGALQYCCASNRAPQCAHASARDARSGRRQASRAGRHPQTRRGMRRSAAVATACVAHAWGTPAIAALGLSAYVVYPPHDDCARACHAAAGLS